MMVHQLSYKKQVEILAKEYSIWQKVHEIKDWIVSRLKLEKPKDVYELDNILGRWTLCMDNKNSPLTPDYIHNKFSNELVEKHLCQPEESEEIVSYCEDVLNREFTTDLETYDFGKLVVGKWEHKVSVTYKDFRMEMSRKRYDEMFAKVNSMTPIAIMCMRYGRHFAPGMQWSVPPKVLEFMQKYFRAEVECFGSPLNNTLPKFCSLYPDVDNVFGSQGDFFQLKMDVGTFIVNPPFIEAIMDQCAERMVDALDGAVKHLRFFYFMPSWTDSKAYITLSNHPNLVYKESLPKFYHFYFDGLKAINAAFNSTFFVLEKNNAVKFDYSQCTSEMKTQPSHTQQRS
jgi:hypothetical protein